MWMMHWSTQVLYQMRGVNSKIRVGAISFTDPNENVGIAST